MKETKQNKLRKRILTAAAAVLAAAVLACVLYIGNYYHAEEPALEAIAHPAQDITVSEEEDRKNIRLLSPGTWAATLWAAPWRPLI